MFRWQDLETRPKKSRQKFSAILLNRQSHPHSIKEIKQDMKISKKLMKELQISLEDLKKNPDMTTN